MMEGKRYRFIWWLIAAIVVAVLIWYAIVQNQAKDYTDGTLVWSPADTFCMNNRRYCTVSTVMQPSSYEAGGMEICRKSYI